MINTEQRCLRPAGTRQSACGPELVLDLLQPHSGAGEKGVMKGQITQL